MNKKDFTGWKDVFKFSFSQGIKSKAYLVTVSVLFFVVLVLFPVLGWIQSKDNEVLENTSIDKVYIYNNSEAKVNFSELTKESRYSEIEFIDNPSDSFETKKESMKTDALLNDILVEIDYQQVGAFALTFIKPANTGIASNDLDQFTNDFRNFFESEKNKYIEVSPEQLEIISRPVTTDIQYAKVNESGEVTFDVEEQKNGITMAEYSVIFMFIMVVMMIISMCGGQISNAIVTEKSNKIIEYLMINVRPLALILGKILSAVLLVIIQLSSVLVAYLIGSRVSNSLFASADTQVGDGVLSVLFDMLSNISAAQVIICVIAIILGVAFFSFIAGLAGASVSKIDELQEGMKMYQLVCLIGCYSAIFLCIKESSGGVSDGVLNGLSIFPISAPFVLPSNLLLGKVSITIGLISIIILAISTYALIVFVSKVYEAMIFYNGKVLKIKDIIEIAKNRKMSVKEEK